jgi:hypothetical protein
MLLLQQQHQEFFAKLHGRPFWIPDIQEHKQQDIATKGLCCFNHIIGLPKKDGIPKPMFNYELQLYNLLFGPDSVR